MKSISLKPSLWYALLLNIKFFFACLAIYIVVKSIDFFFPELSHYSSYLYFIAFLPFLLAARNIIYWRMVTYEINQNQIKYCRGILNYRTDYLELYRVKDFDTQQSIFLRMLKLMNLSLATSDTSHPTLVLRGIPVSNLPDVLRDLVQKARIKNRVLEVD